MFKAQPGAATQDRVEGIWGARHLSMHGYRVLNFLRVPWCIGERAPVLDTRSTLNPDMALVRFSIKSKPSKRDGALQQFTVMIIRISVALVFLLVFLSWLLMFGIILTCCGVCEPR